MCAMIKLKVKYIQELNKLRGKAMGLFSQIVCDQDQNQFNSNVC